MSDVPRSIVLYVLSITLAIYIARKLVRYHWLALPLSMYLVAFYFSLGSNFGFPIPQTHFFTIPGIGQFMRPTPIAFPALAILCMYTSLVLIVLVPLIVMSLGVQYSIRILRPKLAMRNERSQTIDWERQEEAARYASAQRVRKSPPMAAEPPPQREEPRMAPTPQRPAPKHPEPVEDDVRARIRASMFGAREEQPERRQEAPRYEEPPPSTSPAPRSRGTIVSSNTYEF